MVLVESKFCMASMVAQPASTLDTVVGFEAHLSSLYPVPREVECQDHRLSVARQSVCVHNLGIFQQTLAIIAHTTGRVQ